MTNLYLIRLPIDLRALYRWAGERGWTAHETSEGRERDARFDEGRALHHLLAETFGKAVLQPFRLFKQQNRPHANLYAYSSTGCSELISMAQIYALPEVFSVCDPCKIEEKKLPPELWRQNRRIGFDTRVRPICRLLKPCGKFPKGAEVDTFLVAGLRPYPEGPPSEESGRLTRTQVYQQWLAERLEGAAELENVELSSFARHRAARTRRGVEGPDAVMQGSLIILNPELFVQRLAKGIGRHTAYGYGMLMVRPPGRQLC